MYIFCRLYENGEIAIRTENGQSDGSQRQTGRTSVPDGGQGGKMADYGILAVLLMLCAGAAGFCIKRFRSGGCCCCGGGERPEKQVKVKDRKKANYPYGAVLNVDGMVCAACARRAENALNRLDGVWARADLEHHQVKVNLKTEPDEQLLREAVSGAGFPVTGFVRGSGAAF